MDGLPLGESNSWGSPFVHLENYVMRKYLLSLVLIVLPSLGFAQLDLVHRPGPTIALKAGMFRGLSPSGLREDYKGSYSAGAWVSVPVSSQFVIRSIVEFGELAFDVRNFLEERTGEPNVVSVSGGDYRSLAIGIDALIGFNRSSMVAVYGLAGLGYYSGTVKDFRVRAIDSVSEVEGESDSGIGLSAGAGIRADMNEQLGAFAEGKVVYGLMDQNHLVLPIGVGLFLKL